MNVTFRNQICASNVDWRIILLQIVRNRRVPIRNFTGTNNSLKKIHTYQQKQIRHHKTVQMKASCIIHTTIWHICLPMHKFLKQILDTASNLTIGSQTQVGLVTRHQRFRIINQACWRKQINIQKFQMGIQSQRNKQENLK